MSKKDVQVGDRVQTIKGRGVVVTDWNTNFIVELDGHHGTYFFGKEHVWKLVKDNDEDANEYIEEIKKTGIVGKWEGVPIIEIPALISWLNDQKYTNIDETSDNMTEEFEREYQWELSRNCFINKVIRQLKELK